MCKRKKTFTYYLEERMRIFAKNIFASPPCLLHYFHWAITPLCLDRINLNARALTHVPEITFLCKSFSKWQLCTVPFKIISIFFRGRHNTANWSIKSILQYVIHSGYFVFYLWKNVRKDSSSAKEGVEFLAIFNYDTSL